MTRIDWLAAIQKGFAAGKSAEHAENAGPTGPGGPTTCNSLIINDLQEPADRPPGFSLGVLRVPWTADEIHGTPGTRGILLGVPLAEGKDDLKIQSVGNGRTRGTPGTPNFSNSREIPGADLGHPSPRIVMKAHFGFDGVPPCYASAWQALLSQCPAGVGLYVWEAAIYDGADLFGWWGAELDRFHWPPGDLFDVPYDGRRGGLAWFIRGDPVVALGPAKAFTQARRVFERMRS
jgi:hypothetical protein